MNFYFTRIYVNNLVCSVIGINHKYLLRVYKDIKEKGLKRPLIVEELPKNKFKILWGNLRFLSFIKLKQDKIPCVIITKKIHKDMYKINSHKELLKICKVDEFSYNEKEGLRVNGPGLGYNMKGK
mgnify:FL=1